MPTTTWTPTHTHWGDLAHAEVMAQFEGKLKTRAVALCLWQLALDPNANAFALEATARRDPEIATRPDGSKIHAYAMRQAKKLLGNGQEESTKPQLPKRKRDRRRLKRPVTHAVNKADTAQQDRLVGSAEIVDEFLGLSAELADVQAALVRAHQTMLELPRDIALELAEVSPDAAMILNREGLLDPNANSWPDGAPSAARRARE